MDLVQPLVGVFIHAIVRHGVDFWRSHFSGFLDHGGHVRLNFLAAVRVRSAVDPRRPSSEKSKGTTRTCQIQTTKECTSRQPSLSIPI